MESVIMVRIHNFILYEWIIAWHCMSLSKDVSYVLYVLGLSTSYPNDSWKCKINDKHDYRLNQRKEARKMLGYFVWKITILRQKNQIFSKCRGKRENCWGISCEKSRFYAKKSYFFPNAEGSAKIVGVFRVFLIVLVCNRLSNVTKDFI
jgi:hypothetical protein